MRILTFLAMAALTMGLPAARLGDGTISIEVENEAAAQSAGLSKAGFQSYLPRLRAEAQRAGIGGATLDRVFPNLAYSSRTIELDRALPFPDLSHEAGYRAAVHNRIGGAGHGEG